MLTKITAARATNRMQGERRTVTMLFADIQGSTSAAEGVDPEDWSDIVNGAFEHLIAPVYRYEGTLARLLGDAVLAFFGAPIAHEDDPVRAVRAGLEITERMESYRAEIDQRWGIPLGVRVGVNTGLVVVGEVGSDLKVEYTALGDAVNVAARMEQTAEPGTVRVTADTWALVSDLFEGEQIGPVEVKGKSEPVVAVRVIAPRREAQETRVARPIIGRAVELERLEDLIDRLRGGSGWLASIMGEAGLGKSRLVDELRKGAGAATKVGGNGDLGWMSAHNESYETSVPYSAIAQILVRWWGLEEAEDPYRVVEEAVEAVVPDLTDGAAYLAHVASVSLPRSVSQFLDSLEPPVLDLRVRQAVTSYLEAEAGRRPLLVGIEDLHWADPLTLGLIEEMMALTEVAPLGILFTMRPYRDEPPWHIHEVAQRDRPHRYHHIDLASLDRESAEQLLDTLVEGLSLPASLRERILERSDGNPLFIEQMAQAIREREEESDRLTVPTGLSSLLTARLDRLEAESKLVAQFASVIGAEFDRSTLAGLMGEGVDLDRHLTDLLRREILVESGEQPGEMAFHHALMQEAAYSTMLLRTRRELHGRLAEHLLATHPGALQEIALHLVEAGDMERAFPHLVVAGESSARSMALSDAIRFFTTALESIPSDADPELVVRAHDGLGVAYTLVPDLTQSEAAYQRLVDYADDFGRPSAKVTALNRLALNTAMLGGDLETAHHYLEDAYTLATEVGDEFGLAQYHMNACTIAGLGGDLGTSVVHDEETARWGARLGADEIRVEGLTRLAENTVWLMDFDRAIPAVAEAIEAAREAGDEHNLAILHSMAAARLRYREGDTEGALQLMLDNEPTLARYSSFFLSIARSVAAYLLYELGRVEEALEHLHSARSAAAQAHLVFFEAVAAAGMARVYASVGMSEAMEEAVDSAMKGVRTPLGEYVSSTVWSDLGHAALATGDLDSAEGHFERCLSSSSASKYWEKPRALIGLALVQSSRGNTARGHSLLDEAQTFLLEKEIRSFDAHLEHARGELFLVEGEPAQAAGRLETAGALAAEQGCRVLGIEIAGAAARASAARGDGEAARSHGDAARVGVREVANSINDPELRRALETVWLGRLDVELAT